MFALKWNMFAVVVLFISISKSVKGILNEPDFDSGWVSIASANYWRNEAELKKAFKSFTHGLGELPLLVDVQVKAVDGLNKGFIFPATGHVIRDDDRQFHYANVAYIYDNTTIIISAPAGNRGKLGSCIYTGFSPYWEGPADQQSYSALVRARAWRAGSLPKPDFTSKGIKLTAASGRRTDSYVSVPHGLSEHPSLVISRIRFPQGGNYPNFHADSVGSGSIIYERYHDNEHNGYVVYGFDNSSIRVWAPSRPWGFLFSGGDGGSNFHFRIYTGFLELYAWREETLTPSMTLKKILSPARISSSDLTMHFQQERAENETFTRAWVQAVDGVNSGYRFVGNGALAYDSVAVSTPCSYGGLVYAYTNSTMRFWKPGKATNGALICIQYKFGERKNSQASSNGIAIVKTWQLGIEASVRIRGGWTKYSGLIEVFVNKSWYPVCLDGFTKYDAMVVCNISGHTFSEDSTVSVHSNKFYNIKANSGRIKKLNCTGSEESLLDCGQGAWMNFSDTCEDELAAVNCRTNTDIRLMSGDHVQPVGSRPVTGRVEVLYNGNWGSICDDNFDDKDAHVLCSMLGFSFGRFNTEEHGPSAGQTIIDDLECLGVEHDISECKARQWGSHDCQTDESVVIHCDHVENIDPCLPSYHTRLPDLEFRYVSTKFNSSGQIHKDSKLPYRWYYVGENKMPELKPELGRCGTYFPIYSLDKAPDTLGDVRTVRAKQVNGVSQYEVQVKKCEDFYVYRLPATNNDRSGYCFGTGSEESAPQFIINSTETVVMHNETDVWFVCKFDEPEGNLFYQVYWNIEGNTRISIVKGYCDRSNMSQLHLTEAEFVENDIQLGIYIKCDVRPFWKPYGQPGPKSKYSSAFYAGIDIKTPKLQIRSGETSYIQVVNTVPIVCNTRKQCNVSLRYTTREQSTCASIPAFPRGCDVQLRPDYTGKVTSVEITTAETGEYSVPGKYNILMEIQPPIDGVKLWRRSNRLKETEVDILQEPSAKWRGRICSARNDPHMNTFDGRSYEHHEADGEYILYRHRRFADVEVQHKIFPCYKNARVKCNCGVAVRAGKDVYVIDVCDESIEIGYKLCGDRILTTRKENDFTYTIFLPYGTAVKVRIDNTPWRRSGKLINIDILPSLHDTDGSSVGLCGTLNGEVNDDFLHRNSVDGKNHVEFIRSWRVLANESLFAADLQNMKLNHMLSNVCACQKRNRFGDVSCARSGTSCSMIGKHTCRTVRHVSDHRRIPVRKRRAYSDQLMSKGGNETEKKNWTIEEAEIYCKSYFDRINTYNLCQQIPSTHTNISLQNCILDITLTNSVEWTSITRQSMLDTCNTELARNATVRQYLKEKASENATDTGPDSGLQTTASPIQNPEDIIIDKILEDSCLNNCSDHGICVGGACSCDDGYGASDCSIDMNFPPRIAGLQDGGFCDESNTPCSYLSVYGEVFIGNEVICRLLEFQVDINNKKTFELQHTFVEGIADSLVEAVCDLRQLHSQKSINEQAFVRGYQLSMSNDGAHYSIEHIEVYLFDSTCQSYFTDRKMVQFALKEGFCFIEQRCFAHGKADISETRYCDTGVSNYSWTDIPTTTTTTSPNAPTTATATKITTASSVTMTKKPLTDLNIGLISATTIAIIISILLAIILCRCARTKGNLWNKLQNSTVNDQDSETRQVKEKGGSFFNPVYNEDHD